MLDPKACAVLVPLSGSLEPETEAGLRTLGDAGYVVRLLRGASDIALARSFMASQAMRDGFPETLWIDGDQAFTLEDVERIRSHNLPFVAGLYPRKGVPEMAAKFRRNGTYTFGKGGGIIEMQYVGMGFTHIRAEVYDAIRHELPEVGGGYDGERITPYFLPLLVRDDAGLSYLSEDYSFCHRAREVGYPPMADTRLKIGHCGRKVWTWDDFVPDKQLDSLQLQFGPSEGAQNDMNENDLYAKIGRLQTELEAVKADRSKLVRVCAEIVSGECDVSRVLVNLTDETVSWVPVGETPSLPARFNGVPVCVVAPPPEEQAGFRDSVGPVVLTGRKLQIRRELAEALNGNGKPEGK